MIVYLGLSGGVDSAVSALLLQQAGFDVRCVFMKNFTKMVMSNGEYTPCWTAEWRDALRVAAHLKLPLERWDFETEYRRDVFDYFIREYAAGRTPNPDVLCNSTVKFGAFFERARAAGADFVATGHYAQTDGSGRLLRAVDELKDQTYFLHQISNEALRHTRFPIGHVQKSQVRALAAEVCLPVAEKKDSTGVCFVGEVPIRELLGEFIPSQTGPIETTDGTVLGQHDGLAWYTIGQRHGFGGGAGEPWYVCGKDMARNVLIVCREHDSALYTRVVRAERVHWIREPQPDAILKARFRHRQDLQTVSSWEFAGGVLTLHMLTDQRAITPGQFAVMYEGTECLGGGVIF